jgi:hypothetical protein
MDFNLESTHGKTVGHDPAFAYFDYTTPIEKRAKKAEPNSLEFDNSIYPTSEILFRVRSSFANATSALSDKTTAPSQGGDNKGGASVAGTAEAPRPQTGPTDSKENKAEATIAPLSRSAVSGLDLKTEEARLQKIAGAHISPASDCQSFINEMHAFENRCRNNKIPDIEVARSLYQLSRLLDAKVAVLNPADRQLAARSLMHELAHPMSDVNQGAHPTCAVTALSKHFMSQKPSVIAEMVATTGIKGSWVDPDGMQIKIRPADLLPGEEESVFPPAKNGQRTYATQLTNAVMINDILQRRDPAEFFTQDKVTYRDGTPRYGWDEQGRMVDRSEFEGNNEPQIKALAARLMLGRPDAKPEDFYVSEPGIPDVAALKNELARIKREGLFPVYLGVDGSDAIFQPKLDWLDKLLGEEPTPPGSGHALNITNYDEKTGRLRLSNHWGGEKNITIDVETLFRAMQDHRISSPTPAP